MPTARTKLDERWFDFQRKLYDENALVEDVQRPTFVPGFSFTYVLLFSLLLQLHKKSCIYVYILYQNDETSSYRCCSCSLCLCFRPSQQVRQSSVLLFRFPAGSRRHVCVWAAAMRMTMMFSIEWSSNIHLKIWHWCSLSERCWHLFIVGNFIFQCSYLDWRCRPCCVPARYHTTADRRFESLESYCIWI